MVASLKLGFLAAILIFLRVESFVVVKPNFHRFSNILMDSTEMDPNFEENLPSLLKAGLGERQSGDLAKELRQKYLKISETKKKAAQQLRPKNEELAIELEEIADELQETHEKFVQAALYYDSWSRSDSILPKQLRAQRDLENVANMDDPNYTANLPNFLEKGNDENRPDYDLPSELRMLKYKNMAEVKRLAAKELKTLGDNEALVEELEDLALEIEESHQRFQEMANSKAAMIQSDKSVTNR